MATFRENTKWLSWWTVFFWGWFLGYGPLMAMFVACISCGRTIRQMVMMISVGDDGVSALQSFIVVTAVPVSLVLLPSLWTAPAIARKMAKEQGLYAR